MAKLEARWIYLPYCLRRLADGRYIVLNRDYKPVGLHTTDWVDYENHPSAAKLKISAAAARKMSWKASEDLESIMFYNDGCVPTSSKEAMNAYLARLAVFAKLLADVHR